ncbi:hypothetical protein NOGI109294_10230 [Nocardiopsis gilva]|uniref:hypothetical protein n=1 Tax=Nocardiopsis gilva TaxID=280236 RepID=UPI000345967C|nr:hypothetical protein [Nocardiopsis gilva]
MSATGPSIRDAAIAAHEYYLSLRSAGFTRGEGLYLTAGMMSGGPKPPKGDGE